MSLPIAAYPIHVLTSQHDWLMSLWMLASLESFSGYRWRIFLHEDGSLTDDQIAIFERAFAGTVTVIKRADADQRMAAVLKSHQRCRSYRDRMPHGLKVFDIVHLGTSDRYLMVDPDVLFFRHPEALLRYLNEPAHAGENWFNRDFQEPSPISPEAAADRFGLKLWPHVNSGLCALNRESLKDLDAMEAWLEEPELGLPENQWRVEQTLIALAASKNGKGGLLPSAYEVSPNRNATPDVVARHYIGCVRDRFLSEGVLRLRRQLLNASSSRKT